MRKTLGEGEAKNSKLKWTNAREMVFSANQFAVRSHPDASSATFTPDTHHTLTGNINYINQFK